MYQELTLASAARTVDTVLQTAVYKAEPIKKASKEGLESTQCLRSAYTYH